MLKAKFVRKTSKEQKIKEPPKTNIIAKAGVGSGVEQGNECVWGLD